MASSSSNDKRSADPVRGFSVFPGSLSRTGELALLRASFAFGFTHATRPSTTSTIRGFVAVGCSVERARRSDTRATIRKSKYSALQ
jgi:hypothetical protein